MDGKGTLSPIELERLKKQAKDRPPVPSATVEKLLEVIDEMAEHHTMAEAQAFSEGWDKALEDAAKYCESYTLNLDALYEMIENSGGYAIRTGEKYAHGIRAMKGKSE